MAFQDIFGGLTWYLLTAALILVIQMRDSAKVPGLSYWRKPWLEAQETMYSETALHASQPALKQPMTKTLENHNGSIITIWLRAT